jgi:HK97 family phage prohead protease
MGKRERRINQTQFEIRTLEDGKTVILEGYALKFGKRSEDFGGVDEILERGCLDKTDMSNVVALINHDPNYPLARNTVREGPGHLSLSVDDTGLRFSLIPTDTAYAKDLMTNMAAGVVNQCSFAFTLAESGADWSYESEKDMYHRAVKHIERLWDVSIVTTPAYPDTEAQAVQRSMQESKEAYVNSLREKQENIRKRKLDIELELLNQ